MPERLDKIEQLRYLLRKINRRLEHYFTVYLQQYNITLPQFLLLREVYRNNNLPITELSHRLGLANSTVCGIVDRLEKRKLVSRTRDEGDRRLIKVSITPKTEAEVINVRAAHAAYLTQLTRNITDADIDQMVHLLNILERELDRQEI